MSTSDDALQRIVQTRGGTTEEARLYCLRVQAACSIAPSFHSIACATLDLGPGDYPLKDVAELAKHHHTIATQNKRLLPITPIDTVDWTIDPSHKIPEASPIHKSIHNHDEIQTAVEDLVDTVANQVIDELVLWPIRGKIIGYTGEGPFRCEDLERLAIKLGATPDQVGITWSEVDWIVVGRHGFNKDYLECAVNSGQSIEYLSQEDFLGLIFFNSPSAHFSHDEYNVPSHGGLAFVSLLSRTQSSPPGTQTPPPSAREHTNVPPVLGVNTSRTPPIGATPNISSSIPQHSPTSEPALARSDLPLPAELPVNQPSGSPTAHGGAHTHASQGTPKASPPSNSSHEQQATTRWRGLHEPPLSASDAHRSRATSPSPTSTAPSITVPATVQSGQSPLSGSKRTPPPIPVRKDSSYTAEPTYIPSRPQEPTLAKPARHSGTHKPPQHASSAEINWTDPFSISGSETPTDDSINLREESELKRLGYSVAKGVDIQHRRQALDHAVDRIGLKKVVAHLAWLMRFHRKNRLKREAVESWRADFEWLRRRHGGYL